MEQENKPEEKQYDLSNLTALISAVNTGGAPDPQSPTPPATPPAEPVIEAKGDEEEDRGLDVNDSLAYLQLLNVHTINTTNLIIAI